MMNERQLLDELILYLVADGQGGQSAGRLWIHLCRRRMGHQYGSVDRDGLSDPTGVVCRLEALIPCFGELEITFDMTESAST